MADIIQIDWTAGSIDEARKISRYLVQEGLIASAGIIPWIEKIFLLNGQLETTQESKISFITKREHFDAVKKVIMDNSSYQIPEITYSFIDHLTEEYLKWVERHG